MAHKRRTHRRKSHTRRQRRNNLVGQSVEATSRRYMPKVKSGLENVGSKVITTTKKSVPFLQRLTQKLFGVFRSKTLKK